MPLSPSGRPREPLFVIAMALVTWFVHRQTAAAGSWADAPPATASAVRATLVVVFVAVGVVAAAALRAGTYDYGLRHTASGQFIGSAINRLSDIDRDGYGIFWFPRDPSPLNSAIHPYAVDVPGDGIDQDGVAGDLPASAAVYREPPPPAGAWPHPPSVILIVLESVRADAVGATSDGKEVTPNLDALARSGVSVPLAYSHNGYTIQSRFHILSGSLANLRGGTTLLDDFHARGYETAYFSAQDESFGDSPIDFRSADVFYDARSDRARRFSAYTTPGSLAVPYTVVEERVTAFLAHRRTDRPLFLYVNFQDTHFPYHHASMQPLISSVVLSPSQMTASRGDDLKRMYLNAVANVDGAIGRVLAAARTSLGDPGVVVMSDHGESLFDAGFLGHGYALNDVQTRIPMIVSGMPMRIAQPFGQAALRDALAAALQRMGPGASRTPTLENSGSRVFQYLGTIDRPAEVGWTTSAGRTVYDFRTDSFDAGGGFQRTGALAGAERDGFQRLVQYWESMRWAASRAADGR